MRLVPRVRRHRVLRRLGTYARQVSVKTSIAMELHKQAVCASDSAIAGFLARSDLSAGHSPDAISE